MSIINYNLKNIHIFKMTKLNFVALSNKSGIEIFYNINLKKL